MQRTEGWRDQLRRPEMVAPLIVPPTPANPGEQTGVLVSFGGLFSRLTPQPALITYARTMIECVVEALAHWPGRITISAGEHVLNRLDHTRPRLARRDVRFVDLSHAEYLRELESSRLLISSPGLHATQEAFARNIPCVHLPSQNLSQALALRELNRAGAASALDWESIYGPMELAPSDEEASCLRIAHRIDRFAHDVPARGRLIWHLTAQLLPDVMDRLAAAQARFYEPFQGHGAGRVADYIRHLVSPGSREHSLPAAADVKLGRNRAALHSSLDESARPRSESPALPGPFQG
jgi:hypothetical protein